MRGYIFTNYERDRINQYLSTGVAPDGFPVIKTRMLKTLPKLIHDIKIGFQLWTPLRNEASADLRDSAEVPSLVPGSSEKTSSIIPSVIVDDVRNELISRNTVFEAVENSSSSIMIITPDSEIVYANKAMTDITGRSVNWLVGRSRDIFFACREGYVDLMRRRLGMEEDYIDSFKEKVDEKYNTILCKFAQTLTHPARDIETSLGN